MENPYNQNQNVIVDPEKITQANRIKALLERRRRVIDSLQETSIANIQNEKAISDSRLIFISNLRSLILDLYPVLLDGDSLDNDGEPLGTFYVDPPESITDINTKLEPGSQSPKPREITVESIDWFTDRDLPIEIEWELELRNSVSKEYDNTKEALPPLRICIKAAKEVMQKMNEMKIDVDIVKETGKFGYDYDELESEEEKNNEH